MALRAVILAAGQGTRMKSTLPKVLHDVAGRPMISWVVDAVAAVSPDQIMVVIGHGAEAVEESLGGGIETCIQEEQLGTGHATLTALQAMGDASGDAVLVLPGDTPLLRSETLELLARLQRRTSAAVSMLTADVANPAGYGRILRDGWDRVVGVVEHKDAAPGQLNINEVNGGVYVFAGDLLPAALQQLKTDNVQGEYYLTDVISILAEAGHSLGALKATEDEILGVNNHDQLAEAARLMRRRITTRWMREGVWVQDADNLFISAEVVLEPGVRLYSGVHLEGATRVRAGASVGPDAFVVDSEVGEGAHVWYSVVRGAAIGPECEVGPYASLRPGTVLGRGAKAGTFVETKNTVVGEKAKVPHLSYMGDAEIGAGANIGAGTITCNYDGFQKHKTVIGERAFVGSDTMLVAPVTIGEDAVTGAGSVISEDVSPGALAIERSPQQEIPGYAARRRKKAEG